MVTNLQKLPPWLLILAVVIILLLITGILIWARRRKFRLTKVELTAGPVKAEFEPEKVAGAPQADSVDQRSASINISGNKLFGKNKMAIRREDTNVSDNWIVGENDLEVGAKPGPKPDTSKREK